MRKVRKGSLIGISDALANSLGIHNKTGIVVRGPYESYIKVSSHIGKDVLSILMVVDAIFDNAMFEEIPTSDVFVI